MLVSVSFQFVGFLLTYVLHTTHAAKFGSRVGLGLTLVQFGFNLRSRAEELIETGMFPTDPSDPEPSGHFENEEEEVADNALKAIWGSGTYPFPLSDPNAPMGSPPVTIHNIQEAEAFAHDHNMTLGTMLDLPSAADVGRANEYFSFILMSVGWFVVLTSLGGYWRVKRFERGLRQAQRDSEDAQAAANREEPIVETVSNVAVNDGDTSGTGPRNMAYYTQTFAEAIRGADHIRRGFFGQLGPRMFRGRGHGHVPVPGDDWDAQDVGLEPMANEDSRSSRRGLWGV